MPLFFFARSLVLLVMIGLGRRDQPGFLFGASRFEEDAARMRNLWLSRFLFFLTALCALGVILTFPAWSKQCRLDLQGKTVPGKIVDWEKWKGSYRFGVTYTFTIDGQVYSGQIGMVPDVYSKRNEVVVRYLPGDPGQSQLVRLEPVVDSPIAPLIFGILFAVMGRGAWIKSKEPIHVVENIPEEGNSDEPEPWATRTPVSFADSPQSVLIPDAPIQDDIALNELPGDKK